MIQMPNTGAKYIQVILPIKYRGDITYLVPAEMVNSLQLGCRVKVDFANRIYSAVVKDIFDDLSKNLQELCEKGIVVKEILEIEENIPVSCTTIKFWEQIAEYYMCSVGEVYKAAYPSLVVKQEKVKSRKSAESFFKSINSFHNGESNISLELPQLSESQNRAYDEILAEFSKIKGNESQKSVKNAEERAKPVLLHGVTGSGKTEIYINLAAAELNKGKSVLYLVPEIALTKQLQNRLKNVFSERLLVYHSKQTLAEKNRIHKILSGQYKQEYLLGQSDDVAVNDAVVVLGTRSSLFLPYQSLGLVVIDEEHDSSYKQTEPAPRYQGRDAAIMLANIHNAKTLLGSATPSFESEYNCRIGRFARVGLYEKYYGAKETDIEIVDIVYARKTGQMKGNFSQKLINSMRKVLEQGEQVLVFQNRRSYSPVVECVECGTMPKCPCCNVYLSYHKYNNTLRCHYCDYTVSFKGICPKCGLDTLKYKGAGTEKIEEEITALFPEYNVARFDADIAESKRREEAVIKAFAQKEIDILVGTQMISKGFDFEHLGLVVVLQADSILGIQDFRADEKALQIFSQLMGRTGRRDRQGKIIIQTNQKEHPVIRELLNGSMRRDECDVHRNSATSELVASLMEERKEFIFAPYVRMVKVIIKHPDKEKLDTLCNRFSNVLKNLPCKEVTGPFIPAIDKVRGEWIKCFYVKFLRDAALKHNKMLLQNAVAELKAPNAIILDVDPV